MSLREDFATKQSVEMRLPRLRLAMIRLRSSTMTRCIFKEKGACFTNGSSVRLEARPILNRTGILPVKMKHAEKGYILLLSTLFILISISLGVSLSLLLRGQIDLSAYEIRRIQALHIAEIGVNILLYNLNHGKSYSPPSGPYTSGIDIDFPAVSNGIYKISTLNDDAVYRGSYAKVKVIVSAGTLTDAVNNLGIELTIYVSILKNNNTYIYYPNSWRE